MESDGEGPLYEEGVPGAPAGGIQETKEQRPQRHPCQDQGPSAKTEKSSEGNVKM